MAWRDAFFALLDWSVVSEWEAARSVRGRPPHPESAYLKAFLIRIREGMLYTAQLRRFLLRHPLLVIACGFRLVLDASAPYGFDLEATLPCEFWLREKLRDSSARIQTVWGVGYRWEPVEVTVP